MKEDEGRSGNKPPSRLLLEPLKNLPSEFSSEDIFPACLPLKFALQFLDTSVSYVQVAANSPDVTFKCNKMLLTSA